MTISSQTPKPEQQLPNIGIFDSGVGGLSVMSHITQLLPHEDILYVADQAHVPYGPKSVDQVQQYCRGITSFLIKRQAKIIVLACNTATAAALDYVRSTFSEISFVGMEPAIKPGAYETHSGKIGVLATPGTFDSGRYAQLMARFAGGIEVYEDPCLGLVELIEKGRLNSSRTEEILVKAIKPMIRAGVDTLVLGCTHYPFVLPLIRRIAGADMSIIDPAPAVALQVRRVLDGSGQLTPRNSRVHIQTYTTGQVEPFVDSISDLLDQELAVGKVSWTEDHEISD